jgi:hypothetical protein
MGGIRKEHQTSDDVLQQTARFLWELLKVILSFQPGVQCIELIIDSLLMALQRILPQLLERHKMEHPCLDIRKSRAYHVDKRAIMKPSVTNTLALGGY